MSIALMSAISLICIDVSAPVQRAQAAPLVVAQATEPALRDLPAIAPSGASSADAETIGSDDGGLGEEEIRVVDVPVSEPALAFSDLDDGAVVEKLITALEQTTTLKADFTQIAPSGVVSDGRFYLRRPGFLRFEYDPPTPLLIVANRGVVYVRDEALETTDSYPVGRTPLKYLLSEEFDRAGADILEVERGIDSVAVTFASRDGAGDGEITLIASAPELTLQRWIVRDAQGGSTVVRLSNIAIGEKLTNRLFRAPEAGGQFLKN